MNIHLKITRMKTVILMALSAIIIATAAAQSPADKVFDKYSGLDGFTTVYVSSAMFDLFRQMQEENPDLKDEMDEAISGLNAIKILTYEVPENGQNIDFVGEVLKDFPKGKYTELMVLKEKDTDMKFLIDEVDGRIQELLLLSKSPDESFLITIQGDIDMKNIAKLSKGMAIEGMENFEKIHEEKKKQESGN